MMEDFFPGLCADLSVLVAKLLIVRLSEYPHEFCRAKIKVLKSCG